MSKITFCSRRQYLVQSTGQREERRDAAEDIVELIDSFSCRWKHRPNYI